MSESGQQLSRLETRTCPRQPSAQSEGIYARQIPAHPDTIVAQDTRAQRGAHKRATQANSQHCTCIKHQTTHLQPLRSPQVLVKNFVCSKNGSTLHLIYCTYTLTGRLPPLPRLLCECSPSSDSEKLNLLASQTSSKAGFSSLSFAPASERSCILWISSTSRPTTTTMAWMPEEIRPERVMVEEMVQRAVRKGPADLAQKKMHL